MSARDELVDLLGRHEARWWTHGDQRLSQVLHCSARDCDWTIRQTKSMTTDECYTAHRAHLADVLIAAGWTKETT